MTIGLAVLTALLLPRMTSQSSVRLGAFNIQVFGQSKLADAPTLDVIVQIVRRYDVLLIQEVRDKRETAIVTLLELVNNGTDTYNATISRRLGRTTSKEQYAFFYKREHFQIVDSFHYQDEHDVFEREPFVVLMQGRNNGVGQFSLISSHVDPDNAPVEISALVHVYNESVARWSINDSLILGDFNADCSYVPLREWPGIQLWTDSRFTWLIDMDADTNVATKSSCAYDRIVVAGDQLQALIINGSVGIFKFDKFYNLTHDEALSVSDHYPVELSLMTSLNTDGKSAATDFYVLPTLHTDRRSGAMLTDVLSTLHTDEKSAAKKFYSLPTTKGSTI
ncbi:deoxyribonuclease-1-like isoform X2 [Corticium candelabrum]|uniref:deoxyribonuclease-1-like isoform X2 n=1 Tax=Corticium candelabrum TaxID=121492 RepID=UPI002E274875|nr:deoxyribonuclease-1-like isoform X2 [Corticium candelabrum]